MDNMRYVILTNPVSGKMALEQKRSALKGTAEVLGAEVHGLDIPTLEGLMERARQVESLYDVIVIAGGDGTFSDVINAIDPSKKTVAYLPLGSGNALACGLGYKGDLFTIAGRIKRGRIREFDLIDCDGKKRAVTASVGMEGTILKIRSRLIARGVTGFRAYIHAALAAYFRFYRGTRAEVTIDGVAFPVRNLLTLMITKQPYYGYGLNLAPRARFDDRRLLAFWAEKSLLSNLYGVLTGFTIGNRSGCHFTGEKAELRVKKPLCLQTDGNRAWEADRFTFRVLPKALKIKC